MIKSLSLSFMLGLSIMCPVAQATAVNDFFNSMFQWKVYEKANSAEKAGTVVGRGTVAGLGAAFLVLGLKFGKEFLYSEKKDLHIVINCLTCILPAACGTFFIAQAIDPINEDETPEEAANKLLSHGKFMIFLDKCSHMLGLLDKLATAFDKKSN